MKQKTTKKNSGSIAVLAVLFCVIAAVIGGVIYMQYARSQTAQTTAASTSASASEGNAYLRQSSKKTDAKAYYTDNSEKLIAVIPAKKSTQVYSEKSVDKELTSRGFGKSFPITYEYTMDGSFNEKAQIDTASSAAHPQYSVMYQTKSGDYWTINVCNNQVSAYPVSYNLEHGKDVECILTESDGITAYDSETNCFYKSIPKPDVLVLKHIPAITAEALERLTAQEIEKL